MTRYELISRVLDVLTTPADALSLQSADPALQAVIAQARTWVNGASVVGYGVGRKTSGGSSDLALKIYVDERKPMTDVPESQRVPSSVHLPTVTRSAILTDVEEIGRPALQVNTARIRPVAPGCSVGRRRDFGAGTLGCFVYVKDRPGTPLILSNSHVLADSGLARRGSTICQPGVTDGGGDGDIIAKLTEYVQFDFGPGYSNVCDAAVAAVKSTTAIDPTIDGIGVPVYDATAAVKIGSVVQICGRTSGLSTGRVKDRSFRMRMTYPRKGGLEGDVGYSEQVLCTRYSQPGDSGALVCDTNGRAVGLHWAGSDLVSIFSPIGYALSSLNVSLWPPPV